MKCACARTNTRVHTYASAFQPVDERHIRLRLLIAVLQQLRTCVA
jgi:hypothetical protein